MHGFINSPALAKLVALQMIDEQIQPSPRKRPSTRTFATLRARLQERRTARSSAKPVTEARVSTSGRLVEGN